MPASGEKWATYPARYRDESGEQATTIYNNGRELRLNVREIVFSGISFDALETEAVDAAISAGLTLNCGKELCNFTLEWKMSVIVVSENEEISCLLEASVVLGSPHTNGGIAGEEILLVLHYREKVNEYRDKSGYFEAALLGLQETLPKDTYFKLCLNCTHADYSPYGNGQFGCLACFRHHKAEHLQVRSKDDLFRVWDLMTEWVQETYLCPEFTRINGVKIASAEIG